MPPRRRLTVLAAVVALIAAAPAPVPALAQSAGDEQYEDPFAGQDPGGSDDETQQQEQQPAPAPAEPAQSEPAQATPESSTQATPATPASQQTELPRTGLDAVPLLAIGAVLLGSGVALRVRLRARS
jgi:hypothetical protein